MTSHHRQPIPTWLTPRQQVSMASPETLQVPRLHPLPFQTTQLTLSLTCWADSWGRVRGLLGARQEKCWLPSTSNLHQTLEELSQRLPIYSRSLFHPPTRSKTAPPLRHHPPTTPSSSSRQAMVRKHVSRVLFTFPHQPFIYYFCFNRQRGIVERSSVDESSVAIL